MAEQVFSFLVTHVNHLLWEVELHSYYVEVRLDWVMVYSHFLSGVQVEVLPGCFGYKSLMSWILNRSYGCVVRCADSNRPARFKDSIAFIHEGYELFAKMFNKM